LIDCDLFCCTCNQANAAWIPSFNQVVYGDGGELSDGRTVGPLCNALDVVAHELTHAVTTYSIFDINGDPVGLDYTEQSGALNESFSDFFAAMIDRDDWLMAEDIFDNDALRSLADPTLQWPTSLLRAGSTLIPASR
jgi:Zn-dependent metalloprotease